MRSAGQYDLFYDIWDRRELTPTRYCARLRRAMPSYPPPFLTKGSFRDPAFMENRTAPIHRWVPWIAGFSGQFVQDAFREFLSNQKCARRPLVLDPFAGVGTTLVEAVLHGYDTIGFEINPYASLAARVKLAAVDISPTGISTLLEAVRRAPQTWNGEPPPTHYRPLGFSTRIPFFSERVEPQVLKLLQLLDTYSDKQVTNLGRVALGAVLVKVSNYTYEPSLSSRPGAGKPLLLDADVSAVLSAKLVEMLDDVRWLQQHGGVTGAGRRDVYTRDFLTVNGDLPSGSVDLMITSPPYMNNYHYIRNTRPQLYWLSFVTSPKELHRLEHENFGKFWQTVRDADPIPLMCKHPHLPCLIARLRETRVHAGHYGGPGWANYVTTYFNDCGRFVQVLKRVLRRGGVGVVVIGNSIIQGINIATDQIFADLAKASGLRVERIVQLRQKRVGASITRSSVRRGQRNPAALYESAVILRKR